MTKVNWNKQKGKIRNYLSNQTKEIHLFATQTDFSCSGFIYEKGWANYSAVFSDNQNMPIANLSSKLKKTVVSPKANIRFTINLNPTSSIDCLVMSVCLLATLDKTFIAIEGYTPYQKQWQEDGMVMVRVTLNPKKSYETQRNPRKIQISTGLQRSYTEKKWS